MSSKNIKQTLKPTKTPNTEKAIEPSPAVKTE